METTYFSRRLPPFKFALIADVHVGDEALYEGHIRKLSRHSLGFLDELALELRDRNLDLVVQLGDLIEDCPEKEKDATNYIEAVKRLSHMPASVLHVIGNHEQVNLSVEELCSINGMKTPYFSRDIAGYHCVVLFTASTAHTDIHIDQLQQNWLKDDLAKASIPTLVFVHHPLDDQNLDDNPWFARYPDYCFVEERADVRRILHESGKVIAVFNGHVHQNSCSLIDGIAYITVQSLVEKVAEPDVPSRAYALCEIGDARLTVQVLGVNPVKYQLYLKPTSKPISKPG
jgi:Icc protein